MHLSLFWISCFTKSYSPRNNGFQVMGIQKKRCKFFLELITSTLTITFNPLYRQSYIKTSLDLLRLSLTFKKLFNKNPLR